MIKKRTPNGVLFFLFRRQCRLRNKIFVYLHFDSIGNVMANERIFVSYKRRNDKWVYSLVEKVENGLGVKCRVDFDEPSGRYYFCGFRLALSR